MEEQYWCTLLYWDEYRSYPWPAYEVSHDYHNNSTIENTQVFLLFQYSSTERLSALRWVNLLVELWGVIWANFAVPLMQYIHLLTELNLWNLKFLITNLLILASLLLLFKICPCMRCGSEKNLQQVNPSFQSQLKGSFLCKPMSYIIDNWSSPPEFSL